MRHPFIIGVLAVLVMLASTELRAALTPEEAVARVQAMYDRPGGFKSHFRQESRLRAVHQAERAEGWVYFQRPSRMRWQYEDPPEQKKEVVSDGRQVWMYMPQDNLVMVYPLQKVLRSDLVMRFFSGIGQVRQEFNLSWHKPPEKEANWVVDLFPKKPQPELKRLTLTINPRTYLVEVLEFTNALGEETRFNFSRTQLDLKLEPSFFNFVTPPGAQVVKE